MGAKRILVVEDEEEIAEILALVLRSARIVSGIADAAAGRSLAVETIDPPLLLEFRTAPRERPASREQARRFLVR